MTFSGQKEPCRRKAITLMKSSPLHVGIDQLHEVGGKGRERQDVQAVVFEHLGHK